MRLRVYLLAIGTLILISCRPESQVVPLSSPTVTITPLPSRELANVESIEIHQVDVKPVEVNVIASGHHMDNCSRVDQINQSRTGGRFEISIEILRENNTSCPALSVKFEEFIPLDVNGLAAGLYVVDVNGLQGTFTLQEDNIPDAENAVIGGKVWNDICKLIATEEDGSISPSPGCTEDRDGLLIANGMIDSKEEGESGVLVKLGGGTCPAEGLATTLTDDNGIYLFSGLQAGIYCVSIDELDRNNVGILRIGQWTFPNPEGAAETTVEVAPGESNLELNFGWFEQLTPVATKVEEDCSDKAIFKEDITVPDNTVMTPGETFTKTWQLQNIGSCTWNPDYSIVFANGDPMGALETTPLTTTVEPGETVNLSITLVAPQESGTYRSEWQLVNAEGILFGIGPGSDRPFWVQILVVES